MSLEIIISMFEIGPRGAAIIFLFPKQSFHFIRYWCDMKT